MFFHFVSLLNLIANTAFGAFTRIIYIKFIGGYLRGPSAPLRYFDFKAYDSHCFSNPKQVIDKRKNCQVTV